jgi:hypothetical protein
LILVFNTTFSNNSAISWRPLFLVIKWIAVLVSYHSINLIAHTCMILLL